MKKSKTLNRAMAMAISAAVISSTVASQNVAAGALDEIPAAESVEEMTVSESESQPESESESESQPESKSESESESQTESESESESESQPESKSKSESESQSESESESEGETTPENNGILDYVEVYNKADQGLTYTGEKQVGLLVSKNEEAPSDAQVVLDIVEQPSGVESGVIEGSEFKFTDAGIYKVQVTVTPKEEGVEPLSLVYTVTVNKADPGLEFKKDKYNKNQSMSEKYSKYKTYNFSAKVSAPDGEISYSYTKDKGPEQLLENGELKGPEVGVYVISAKFSGSRNYNESTKTFELTVTGENPIKFARDTVNYTLGTNGEVASTQKAEKTNPDGAIIKYLIDSNIEELGLEVSNDIFLGTQGKVSISNLSNLLAVMPKEGPLTVGIKAIKPGTKLYPVETEASYTLNIQFADAPKDNPTISPTGNGDFSNESVTVTAPAGYKIAKQEEVESDKSFKEKIVYDQDDEERQKVVYLRDVNTGAIARKEIKIPKIDQTKPEIKFSINEKNEMTITVKEKNFDPTKLRLTGSITDINGTAMPGSVHYLSDVQDALIGGKWTSEGDDHTVMFELAMDGYYNLEVGFKDEAGNTSEPSLDSCRIDNTAPQDVQLEVIPTTRGAQILEAVTAGYYQAPVTVKVTAKDDVSGGAAFEYKILEGEDSSDDIEVTQIKQDPNDKKTFSAMIKIPKEQADNMYDFKGNIAVSAVDQAENKSELYSLENDIVVDSVKPKITLLNDDPKPMYTDPATGIHYYSASAILVGVEVLERNFFSDDVKIEVKKDGTALLFDENKWFPVKNEAYTYKSALVLGNGDGQYDVAVRYKDRSGNMADEKTNTVVIDTTRPLVDVKYSNTDVKNTIDGRKYYQSAQTATVTITEANFREDGVKFNITGQDSMGNALNNYSISPWTHSGDKHTCTIEYAEEGNYTFGVTCRDLAGNESDQYPEDHFTIDRTAPSGLTVNYSPSIQNRGGVDYYNDHTTVTLAAHDLTSGVDQFIYSCNKTPGASDINGEIINRAISRAEITYNGDMATASFTIPTVLAYSTQFNGNVGFKAIDRSGNEASYQDGRQVVVDSIAPTANITFNPPVNREGDIAYYAGSVNVSLNINEANFFSEDVVVMVSKDGSSMNVSPSWSYGGGDQHIGSFTLSGDGDYVVSVSYTDRSSNGMASYTSGHMVVDTTIENPTITINGGAANGQAFKDQVVPSVSFTDKNFQSQEIRLVRTRFGKKNEDVTAQFIDGHVSVNAQGGSGIFDTFAKIPENDGIYVLTVKMTDKANHTSEAHKVFTVNRFGSIYVYSDYLISLIKDGGVYTQNIKDDLVITEYNADRLIEKSLNIEITRDGKPLDQSEYTVSPTINPSASAGTSGWYEYTYKLDKKNFEKDGVYKISVSSVDATGNKPQNTNYEDKDILFRVDHTAPEITSIAGLEEKVINADEKEVTFTLFDNIGLKSVKVFIDGKQVGEEITDFKKDMNNYEGKFIIPSGESAQSVRLVTEDLAGNITDTGNENFKSAYTFNDSVIVSTSSLVRWKANKGVFWGTIIGAAAVVGGFIFLLFKKRKKDEK